MGLRWSVVAAVVLATSCVGRDDASGGTTAGDDSSTSQGDTIEVEQCDELLTQTDCESAVVGHGSADECVWFDVRLPGPSCSSTATVPQCVGMSYVGEGCQTFACPGSEFVDGFFRMVDGDIEVFANPSTQCGLAAFDGWNACVGVDLPDECRCLCPM